MSNFAIAITFLKFDLTLFSKLEVSSSDAHANVLPSLKIIGYFSY